MNLNEEYKIFIEWWNDFHNSSNGFSTLRRASSLEKAALDTKTRELVFKLREAGSEISVRKIAFLAGISSLIKENDTFRSFPEAMSFTKDGEFAVHENKFDEIVRIEEMEVLYDELHPVIMKMEWRANLEDLFESIINWEQQATQMRWAEDFYWKRP